MKKSAHPNLCADRVLLNKCFADVRRQRTSRLVDTAIPRRRGGIRRRTCTCTTQFFCWSCARSVSAPPTYSRATRPESQLLSTWKGKNAKPHPTGFWAEEFVTPHRKFTEAGLKVTVASPGGVAPTVDPLSFNLAYNSNDANKVQEQQGYMKQMGSALTSPMRVEDIDPDRFDVIFLVDGHGPMQDMAVHPTTGAVLVAMLDNPKKLVAAVCHGPPASYRRHVRTEHGHLRIGSSPDSAMRKKRRRVLPETRRGSWKIASVFLARVISQKHPGRPMPSPTATSSRVSRTIRPV